MVWNIDTTFIVNFEHISHLDIVFLLLTLSRHMPAGKVQSTSCVQEGFSYQITCYQHVFSRHSRKEEMSTEYYKVNLDNFLVVYWAALTG